MVVYDRLGAEDWQVILLGFWLASGADKAHKPAAWESSRSQALARANGALD
ncbi:hypothetical protein [Paracoccus rhizosphaerae]|uniref:Uncharacterized protein n=1 Tax=Paracoccus rhizosphaerae TaxID=1133347 RepID=A0ABV6CHX3_9RHOB|nr:hypothetical protein [Paracoccus rhizosphaerae]